MDRGSQTEALLLPGVAIAGLLLRFLDSNRTGLWIDEAYSYHLASLSFPDLIYQLSEESTPPLYYVLLRLWMGIFGSSEVALRALSGVISLAGVWCLHHLARLTLRPRAASLAFILFAFQPLDVLYAREARMYSALTLCSILTLYLALEYLRSPRAKILWACGACELAMLLLHNVALWWIAGLNLAFLLIARRKGSGLGRWVGSQAAVFLAYSPWLLVLLKQVGQQSTVLEWFVPYWQEQQPWMHVVDSIYHFVFGPWFVATDELLPGTYVMSLCAMAVVINGIILVRRNSSLRFIGVTAAVAVALAIAYSILFQPVYIPGRTDIYLLPAFILFLAGGMTRLPHRLVTAALLVSYLGLSAVTLTAYFESDEKDWTRRYMRVVQRQLTDGDAVITTGMIYVEAEYYLGRAIPGVELHSFPTEQAEHPAYFNEAYWDAHPEAAERDADSLIRDLTNRSDRPKRLILLYVPHRINERLLERLSEDWQPTYDSGPFAYRQSMTTLPVRIIHFVARGLDDR